MAFSCQILKDYSSSKTMSIRIRLVSNDIKMFWTCYMLPEICTINNPLENLSYEKFWFTNTSQEKRSGSIPKSEWFKHVPCDIHNAWLQCKIESPQLFLLYYIVVV